MPIPTAKLRSDKPTATIRSDAPVARVAFGAILTPGTDTEVLAGTPIGIFPLIITYANAFTISTSATFKGVSPRAWVVNG